MPWRSVYTIHRLTGALMAPVYMDVLHAGKCITGDPLPPLLKVHNGRIVRHAQSWLTPHPHTAIEGEKTGM